MKRNLRNKLVLALLIGSLMFVVIASRPMTVKVAPTHQTAAHIVLMDDGEGGGEDPTPTPTLPGPGTDCSGCIGGGPR